MNQFTHKKTSTIFNKIFICSLTVIFIFAVQIANAQTCAPAPVGLVSWYSGDNDVLDSRSRNNGTLGASSQFAAGQVGQAFQTTSATGSTVTIPDSPSLDFTNAFTIEIWVSPAQVGANNGTSFLTCKGDCGSAVGFSYALILNNTTSNVILRLGNGSTFDSLFSSPLPLNTFTHLAATYDGTTRRIYLNGVLDASGTSTIGTLLNSSQPLTIGGSINSGNTLGIYDEASFYNRVLSASEIASIAGAGTAGKCKPTATTSPNGQVSWFAGDGNALDFAGTNNGTLQNGAGFAVGKVGQSFNFDGSNDFVGLGDPANLKFTNTDFTVEGWFMTPDLPNNPGQLCGARYPIFGYDFGYTVEIGGDGRLRLRKSTSQSDAVGFGTLNPLSTNVFHHFAAIHTPTEMRLYVDGVLDNTLSIANGNIFYGSGDVPELGRFDCGPNDFYLKGKIDETSIYSRALTSAEIQSIFNAGNAGKLKTANTPTGFALSEPFAVADGFDISPQLVNTTIGDATVTFPSVTTAGTTQQIPLDLSLFPSLPTGSASTGLTYDIATTATFAGSPQVCFNLPFVTTSTTFNSLRILHLEAFAWTNRTNPASINFATKTICTSGLTSLSPFAVVSASVSAANASISGQVTTANGNGIRNVVIQLTNSETGTTIFAYTNSLGFYKFENVETGKTYVLNASAKKYQFTNPSRVINLNQDLTDEDFISAVK